MPLVKNRYFFKHIKTVDTRCFKEKKKKTCFDYRKTVAEEILSQAVLSSQRKINHD